MQSIGKHISKKILNACKIMCPLVHIEIENVQSENLSHINLFSNVSIYRVCFAHYGSLHVDLIVRP